LKSSASFFADELMELSLGTELIFIREHSKWTQVQTGNQQGWVATSSLSTKRIIASNSIFSASEVAMAGKGFSMAMEAEYRKNGLDYSMVDYMELLIVPVDDLLHFVTEGRLAKGE
jgi:hypothetical protein